jgi:hypothetical protein
MNKINTVRAISNRLILKKRDTPSIWKKYKNLIQTFQEICRFYFQKKIMIATSYRLDLKKINMINNLRVLKVLCIK